MSDFSTGNPVRDKRIKRVLAELKVLREEPTLANVAAALPPDFDLDQAELDGFLPPVEPAAPTPIPAEHAGKLLIETLPTGAAIPQAPPKSLEKIEAPHAAAAEPPHEATANEAPAREITAAEARHIHDMAKRDLDATRERLLVAQHSLKERRGELANAITVWQRLDDPVTVSMEQQARRFIADSQAVARARKAGKLPPKPTNRPGKSYVDKAAFYSGGGDANDYARGRHLNGGSHRGAFPGRSGMGQINHDPRRGPTPQPVEK